MSYYKRDRYDDDSSHQRKRERIQEDSRRMATASTFSGSDNAFNDSDLNSKFQWQKKSEKDRKSGITADQAAQRDEQRRAETREELHKLNMRRQQRETEKLQREAEQSRVQRLNESAQTQEWLNKEDDFMLEQKRMRAVMRIKGHRAHPIDYLCLNLKFAYPDTTHTRDDDQEVETGLEVDLDEPYRILENLNLDQTKALHADICEFLDLETAEPNKDFWKVGDAVFHFHFTNKSPKCMLSVCQDKLEKIARTMSASHAIDEDVEEQIEMILQGKSLNQLTQLQQSIQTKLRSDAAIDTEYWENLFKSLLVYKAKAKLNDMHKFVLNNRLTQLREKQQLEAERIQSELTKSMKEYTQQVPTSKQPEEKAATEDIQPDDYDPCMSPNPTHKSQLPYEDRQMPLVLARDDKKDLVGDVTQQALPNSNHPNR